MSDRRPINIRGTSGVVAGPSITAGIIQGDIGNISNKAGVSLSSVQLLVEVRKAEVSDDTLKTFEEHKITRADFLDDEWEETQKALDITKPMDIRKLKTLRKNLKKGK